MKNHQEYVDVLLRGEEIEVIDKPVAIDPDTFTPRKGLLTRYGQKLLNEGSKFYGTLTIPWEDKAAADMQEILDEKMKAGRYRSIDDEWEAS